MYKVSSCHFGAISVVLSLLLFASIVLAGDYYGILIPVTATSTIKYYSFGDWSNGNEVDKQTVNEFPAEIVLNDSVDDGTFQEINPFNLHISDPVYAGFQEGRFTVMSAGVFTLSYPHDYLPMLLQFWDITMSGTSVQGTLNENHIEEGAGANMIMAYLWVSSGMDPIILPTFMDEGTVMQGTIDSNNNAADLYIYGWSTDKKIEFGIQLSTYQRVTCIAGSSGRGSIIHHGQFQTF